MKRIFEILSNDSPTALSYEEEIKAPILFQGDYLETFWTMNMRYKTLTYKQRDIDGSERFCYVENGIKYISGRPSLYAYNCELEPLCEYLKIDSSDIELKEIEIKIL